MAGMRKRVGKTSLGVAAAVLTVLSLPVSARPVSAVRTVISADAEWKFFLGDPTGAEAEGFDDHGWRTVSVPHDWSIETAPGEKNGTDAGEGYFPEGVGWYRKNFTAPAEWKGKQVSVEFDGVASNATVYLNGHRIGAHPYAYTSFRLDLNGQLHLGSSNVLAVRVDNSLQPNSRWYSGSGIYRHVRVVVTNPVHVAPWGVFVTTPKADANEATVSWKTEVRNDSASAEAVTVRTTLLDASGRKVQVVDDGVTVKPGETAESTKQTVLKKPLLWSPASPQMYLAKTQILVAGKLVDQVETPFGIRTLAWSVEKGLLLNGEPIKLAGGSVHHDNGPLGAAAFDRAEERRVRLLKDAGFNAVRTAHNPPSPAFLDACDKLGLLVLDEPFDVWRESKRKYDYAQFFDEWWQQDVDAMVKRDRNHPAVILWGIGNEIPEVWTEKGAPIATQIAARVRSLDSTRPLTQAFPGATYGPNPDAAIAQVDIAGYNYNLAQNLAQDHRRVPTRVMMTTESFPADAFEQWALVQDHSYILGEFVWTAMDYLGESGIGAWSYGNAKQATQLSQMRKFIHTFMASMGADGKNPMASSQKGQSANAMFPGFPWHAAYCGDLDLTGFRKPSSYYRDILWNGGDRVFASVRLPETEDKKLLAPGWAVVPTLPSWTWPGEEGKPITVEVYAGTESVRLYVNDKLIGEKTTGREQQFKAEFTVPFTPGTLRAVGVRGGKEVAESRLETSGDPVALRLVADRPALTADGQDLSFVTVEAVDSKGRVQMNAEQELSFNVSGAAAIAAVGNGDGQSQESYAGKTFHLFHGRAQVVLRSTHKVGAIQLSASADGLHAASIALTATKPANGLSELR
jgi:beta-galactosidase